MTIKQMVMRVKKIYDLKAAGYEKKSCDQNVLVIKVIKNMTIRQLAVQDYDLNNSGLQNLFYNLFSISIT